MTKRQFFYIAVYMVFLTWIQIYAGFFTLFNFLWQIAVLFFMFYILFILIAIIFGREKEIKFGKFFDVFAFVGSIFIVVIFSLIWSFVYYNNSISPISLPSYELSNGDKNVKFISMVHIGSQEYYDEIRKDLEKYNKEGYTLFYEGVKPGSEENMEDFNKLLGFNFDNELYSVMARIYGLKMQDNASFISIFGENSKNVDVSIDDIMQHYNSIPDGEKTGLIKATEPVDYTTNLLQIENGMTEKQKSLFNSLGKAVMNFSLKMANNTGFSISGDIGLTNSIVDKRDEVLAEAILNSENKKIVITYGTLHYNGFFEKLKAKDSNWQSKEIKKLYPITTPKKLLF